MTGFSPRIGRGTQWIVLVFIVVLAIAAVAATAVEEPLRKTLERRVNGALKGYTATIGRVDLHPIGLGLTLHDVTVVQNALPRPPTIYIPQWTTSVHWRALLSGALVADVAFTRPAFYMTFQQAKQEAADPTPTTQHGWQEAVESVYPLKINLFRMSDGTLDYFDTGDLPPVRLHHFDVRAENIRNVGTVAGKYPSPFMLRGTLADGADVDFRGRADFLARPHATLRGAMSLRDLALKGLAPALRHMNVDVAGGRLAARGRIEYTRDQLRLALDRVGLHGARIDYVLRSEADEQALRKAAKQTTTAESHPPNRVDVKRAVISKGTFGITNRKSDPPYRLFVSDADARVQGFSNQRAARRGQAWVRGKFMGSGSLALDADFAAGTGQPDFRLEQMKLEEIDLPAMNDFLRAHANIDVTKGKLSVYSQLTVHGGHIEGYVKPLFRDLEVYNFEQDKRKNPLHQVYEAAIGATSSLLTNRPREEVATITTLSGAVESPDTSPLDTVLGLLRNAFVKAILPGLEPGRQ